MPVVVILASKPGICNWVAFDVEDRDGSPVKFGIDHNAITTVDVEIFFVPNGTFAVHLGGFALKGGANANDYQ
jgi:hypothetical protein